MKRAKIEMLAGLWEGREGGGEVSVWGVSKGKEIAIDGAVGEKLETRSLAKTYVVDP